MENRPPIRPFIVLWSMQAISLLGSQLVQFAIVWWLTQKTGSATMLAMATLAALLPQILIGPFAGALVDRWSRRAVMLAADSVIALATLILAGLFWFNTAAVWMIYALLVIRAAGAAFHWPAMQASTTLMIPKEHLARVGGLNQALGGLASILIPPLGALAIEALPLQTVLAIDVATAIPAISVLLLIRIPQPPQAAGQNNAARSVLADMRVGLRFFLGWRGLLMFAFIGVMIHMLARASEALIPILVTQHFQQGAKGYSWFLSAYGIGALIGGVALSIWGKAQRRMVTALVLLGLDGLALLMVPLSTPALFGVAVLGFLLAGILESISLGLFGAIGQTVIPPELQGRVFGFLNSVSYALAPLGLLIAGPFADAFGVQLWWIIAAVVISLMGFGSLLVPEMVHLEDGQPLLAQHSI